MLLHKLSIHLLIALILLSTLQNICFAAVNSSFWSSNDSPLLAKTYGSGDGVVPILTDSNGFYVNADLGPSNISNQTANATAKMMLIIMNNETMLASTCYKFSQYDCSSYQCSMIQAYYTFYEPWFETNNQYAKAPVSLDPSYWTLKNYACLAYQCRGNNIDIGVGRYGAIGLANTPANFVKEVLFSIWINPNLANGILFFGNDTEKYASSSSEISRLPANQDWMINSIGGSIVVGTISYSWNGVLGFDINSDAPGFDTSTFNKIISYIKSYSLENQVTCSSAAYKPVCNYTGSFDFPEIKLIMRNNAWISIPSDLLYINKTDSLFTLNMKILSATLFGHNFISPNYDGMVVLNAEIMSRFYIVFNGINQTIHLYNANGNPGSQEWIYVVIFTLIGLILVGALVFFAVKSLKASDEEMERPVYINYMPAPPLVNAGDSMNQGDQVFSGAPSNNNSKGN